MLFESAHRILTILYRSRTAQLEMRGREDWAPQSATSGGPSQGLGVGMGMPGYGHVRYSVGSMKLAQTDSVIIVRCDGRKRWLRYVRWSKVKNEEVRYKKMRRILIKDFYK